MIQVLRSGRFWLLTLAAMLLAGTMFSMGQWQLRRAAQKEALQAAIEAQGRLPVLDTQALVAMKNAADALHRKATLKGRWLPEHTVYLDNRPMSGKVGFAVVTPLALEDDSQVILVQRGWVQRDFQNRARLPDIATPVGPVVIRGRIAPPPYKLYAFKDMERGRIRQNIDIAAFRAQTGLPLLEVSLLQTGDASEGLLRQWAAPNLGVEKHYGYAFQWFALCALVIMLYGWFQLFLPLRANRRNKNIPNATINYRDK